MKTSNEKTVVTASELESLHFTFHTDAGHGWLQVPLTLIKLLDIHKGLSGFSYKNTEFAFLEEDCDAPFFIKAFLKAIGKSERDFQAFYQRTTDVYDGDTSIIRSYRRYK